MGNGTAYNNTNVKHVAECCRVFTSRTGTSLHKIQKPDKFEAYKRLMLEHYLPLNTIAKKIGISIQTAFDWRLEA